MAETLEATEQVASGTELKPGWRVVRFGDVVRDVKITVDPETCGLERYIAGEHMNTDDLHIRQWGTIGDGYLGPAFNRKFVKGQVLYGSRRTYLRKVAFADFDGVCANTTFVLEPKDDELLPELLPFIMQTESFSAHAVKQSRGSVNPYVNFRDIAWYEFALPPKDEQRRIADILGAADESTEGYVTALRALEACEQATLTNLIYKDGSRKAAQLGQRGQAAQTTVHLREVADIAYGLTVNATRRELPVERPYLRVANVMRGQVILDEIKTIGCTEEDIARFALQKEDVLVVEGHASVDEIGRTALWQGEVEECLHQNHILRVRCSKELVPKYLVAYLNSANGRSYFKRHAKSTSGLNTINSTVLKDIDIPLPEVKEQLLSVALLQRIENNKRSMNLHINQLEKLKKRLLIKLLTVPDASLELNTNVQ